MWAIAGIAIVSFSFGIIAGFMVFTIVDDDEKR